MVLDGDNVVVVVPMFSSIQLQYYVSVGTVVTVHSSVIKASGSHWGDIEFDASVFLSKTIYFTYLKLARFGEISFNDTGARSYWSLLFPSRKSLACRGGRWYA